MKTLAFRGIEALLIDKKGFITQSEADEFSENLFEQLDTKKISGFHPSPLREKMCAEDVRVNPYVSMTEIA